MTGSRAGAGKVKISLEYCVVPARKEVLTKNDRDMSKVHRGQLYKDPTSHFLGQGWASKQMDHNPLKKNRNLWVMDEKEKEEKGKPSLKQNTD